jgi:hypothetical protein
VKSPGFDNHAQNRTRIALMKAGDIAKLIGIPLDAHDDERLKTRTLFEKCLGQSFVISAVESFEGVPFPLARIDVGHVVGKKPWEHTIWVELEYLELENHEPGTCV